ncbi:lipopolysaccharide assembly LapA domain-containing protein [Nocardia sp. NPDC004068]|uniref:LapA family protein n=1 Tax=Nocardia sp. NPDC004068 TaxID=3364303 RepID=UPI0036C158D2
MTSDAVPNPNQTPVHPDEPAQPPVTHTPDPATTSTPVRRRSLRTRTGYTWTALVAAAILGILLLIFILQNSEQQQVHMFFWSFTQPLGVTILLSVIAGALVMALVGGGRILQLRRAAKR